MGSKWSFRGLIFFVGAVWLASLASSGSASAEPQAASPRSSTAANVTPVAEFTPVQYAQQRICCKRGGRDWWSSPRSCRQAGGYRVSARQCRNDFQEVRVCCKRGRYDWWTTSRTCARSGGYRVAGWQCRNG